jgi:hypothetical protein
MTVALDLGTRRLRSLRRQDDKLVARCCQAEYLVLDDIEPVRRLLDRAEVVYAQCDGALMLLGDAASEYSPVFGIPCSPIFPQGRIPRNDPPGRQALAAMVDGLLPEPKHAGELCCMTISGIAANEEFAPANAKRQQLLSQLVTLRGYTPIIVNASTALVLAELPADSFTGMGFEFGAGSCSASLVHRGTEVARVCIPAAGDWIDMELARRAGEVCWERTGNRYLNAPQAAKWKESVSASLLEPSNEREKFLAELVRELVAHVIRCASEAFTKAIGGRDTLRQVSVVIGGGTAKLPGFQSLFEQIWDESQLPVQAKRFHLAASSDYTVARGCLIRAELEAPAANGDRSAA